AEGNSGEVLTTDGAGNVVWSAATAGAVGSDGLTITGDGTTGNELQVANGGVNTLQLADGSIIGGIGGSIADNTITAADLAPNSVDQSELQADSVGESELIAESVTPAKIQPGGANQILRTNGTGTLVTWVDLPLGGGTTELADQATITGDGTSGNEFKVADGGINSAQLATDAVTSIKILNENVTPAKISPHTINGYVLTTVGGAVAWQPVPTNTGPVKGIGKVNSGGGNLAAGTTGLLLSPISNPSLGQYVVSLNGGFVSGSNYIIQLTVQGDNRIYVVSQGSNTFTVQIVDGTGVPANAIWHFTLLQ
ncbi:hypothetical protein, partial [Maribacter arenosus]